MSRGRYHLKRHFAPKSWRLLRKEEKFITKPNPCGHPLHLSIPISIFLKEIGLAKTSKDSKKILNTKTVFLNGRIITDLKNAAGFMDVISIKDHENFRVLLDEHENLTFVKTPENEANKKICKIISKIIISKGKIQLNLSGGINILSDFKCSVGDSLLLELPSLKVIEVLKFEKNAHIILNGGTHTGKYGVIDEIKDEKIWFVTEGSRFETLKKFGFVIGKDKIALKLK